MHVKQSFPRPPTDSASVLSHLEQLIDDALDGSFPASDAPPWTLGPTRGTPRMYESPVRAPGKRAKEVL
jgi:hypothetical protein